ncbi:MAG TPA: ATP-binding protein [Acidimicrobiia bacterium]|jgi:anti-sigma regulatory factor (Ser/Thr protein kinase)|nr:ATP-binding protein [Acidimicrobiia bacterium]
MSAERTFPHAVESIGRARRYALEALGEAPTDILDSIAVMVSELATNSVRHAASPFTVAVDRDHQRVRVAVSDDGSRLPSLRTPEPREYSGRGLQIVRALADEWGVTENVGRPGKTVWFVVTIAPRVTRGGDATATTRPASASTGPGHASSGAARPRSNPPPRDAPRRGPACRAARLLNARRSG